MSSECGVELCVQYVQFVCGATGSAVRTVCGLHGPHGRLLHMVDYTIEHTNCGTAWQPHRVAVWLGLLGDLLV